MILTLLSWKIVADFNGNQTHVLRITVGSLTPMILPFIHQHWQFNYMNHSIDIYACSCIHFFFVRFTYLVLSRPSRSSRIACKGVGRGYIGTRKQKDCCFLRQCSEGVSGFYRAPGRLPDALPSALWDNPTVQFLQEDFLLF